MSQSKGDRIPFSAKVPTYLECTTYAHSIHNMLSAIKPLLARRPKKSDISDFPGVGISMEKATRHPSAIAANKESQSPVTCRLETGDKPTRPCCAFTIESLRHEIDAGVEVSSKDTVYDRR